MKVRANFKLLAAVVLAAAILVGTVLWNDMPGSFVECSNEVPAITAPDEVVQPYSIAHCNRVVPLSERILKLVVSLLALSFVALVASSTAITARVWTSAAACAASAVLALVTLSYFAAKAVGEWSPPNPMAILFVGSICAIAGAIFSWAFVRWRSNTALERSRGR